MSGPSVYDIPDSIPTLFSDGILNLANSSSIVKFYLGRLDPQSDGTHRTVACGQVVMPLEGFVNSIAFVERMVAKLVSEGIISQAALDVARQGIGPA